MLVLFFTTLAAVIALIGYGALDLGGSFTAVIFLTFFFAGAVVRTLKGAATG